MNIKPSVIRERVSHYSILNKLGRGGMGEVYLAEDTKLGRRVAIKFLPEELVADQHARRRLVREAQAAARLDHPNICAIHEVGEEAGHGFIVMQYVEGETLATRIINKPLDLSECLEIAAQVADALAEAHSQGIIHRDVKPQNIMLNSRHQVKVMDFGLAEVIRDRSLVDNEAVTESLLTEPGAIAGTVPYMSPEQVRGESLDARSDLFSLGAVLYEMVTGRQPFAADSAAMTISAIVSREPAPLARYSRAVPPELERIVTKVLQKDREQRYQTARDLLIDLRRLKHHLDFEEELERSSPADMNERGNYPHVGAANQPVDGGVLEKTQATIAAYPGLGIIRHRRGLIIVAAAFVFVIATLFYLFYFPTSNKAIDSIAIMPLVNAGNDPETEYLSDGITESLINRLSEFPKLRVPARTTAFHYKGKEIDPQQVGRELGVRAVLTGRLIQRGDTLDLQVELVETSNGSQIWGGQYNRKMSDLLAFRQELVRDITEKLRLRLSGVDEKRLTKGDAVNTEAYQSYLKGRHFWNRRTPEGLKKAIREFQQAIDKDPTYAVAYAALADCHVFMEQYAGSPASETLPMARAAADRALQIDASSAEAHASLGAVEMYSWNFDAAEREFKRAIELKPNYAIAHYFYAYYLRLMRGRFDEAMAELSQAQQIDPLAPIIGMNIAAIHESKGESDAGIKEAKKVLELEPNFPAAHLVLGNIYCKQRRYTEAIAEHEIGVQLSGRWNLNLGYLGMCYAAAGNRSKAEAILKELEEKYDRGEALGYNIAGIYGVLGEKDQAFTWLEKEFQAHSGTLARIAYDRVMRDALSSDPRCNDLLRRIGLLQE